MTAWRDGHLVRLDAGHDQSGAGWGVFTTVGCDAGRPLLWKWHRERLIASLARLGAGAHVRLPNEDGLRRLLDAERLDGPARVRVAVRAGTDSRWRAVATAAPLDVTGPDLPPARLTVQRWPGVPSMAGHKMLNRDRWDLARRKAIAAGADDALLVDFAGIVLETSVANVWIRRRDTLLTPPAPGRCLPGVMRRWMFETAGSLRVLAKEAEIGVDDVAAADEILLSNALIGVRRVSRVVDRRWTEWPLFERISALGVPAPGWT